MKQFFSATVITALCFLFFQPVFAQSSTQPIIKLRKFEDPAAEGLLKYIPKKGSETYFRYTPTSEISLQIRCYSDTTIEVILHDYSNPGDTLFSVSTREITFQKRGNQWWFHSANPYIKWNGIHKCITDALARL